MVTITTEQAKLNDGHFVKWAKTIDEILYSKICD